MALLRRVLPLLLFVAVAPSVSADVVGVREQIVVDDDAMHVIPEKEGYNDVTYNFTFEPPGPDPTSSDPGMRVSRAKVAFAVDHELPDKPGWFDQDVSLHMTEQFIVKFNTVRVEYRVTIDADHPGWRWQSFTQQFTRCSTNEGHGTFCGAGTYKVEYVVYKDGLRIGNGTVVEILGGMIASERELPGSLLWVIYEDRNLTIAPDFLDDQFLPRANSAQPLTSYGRVKVTNVDFHGLEITYHASQPVPGIKASYGFCRPNADCSYDLRSLTEEVVSVVGSALAGTAKWLLEWLLFSWMPGGPEFKELTDFTLEVVATYVEVLFDDLFLTFRVAIVYAVGYGLLLFIDPMFKYILTPVWWLIKGAALLTVALVRLFLKVISLVIEKVKIPGT